MMHGFELIALFLVMPLLVPRWPVKRFLGSLVMYDIIGQGVRLGLGLQLGFGAMGDGFGLGVMGQG